MKEELFMIHIENKSQFLKEVSEGFVIVDFFATWCSPCRMLIPVLEEVEEEKDIKILKVNVDEQMELASEFHVSSIPFLVFYKDGKRVGEHLGYIPKPNLLKTIEKLSQ